jgi:hypothetical protein
LIDGREPLLHIKFVPAGSSHSKSSKLRLVKQTLKHFVLYISLRKAYALYEVLKVAPLKYKLEYVIYMLIPFALMLTSLYSTIVTLLLLFIMVFSSSLYSLIVYPQNTTLTLRILAGPAILLSRVLRALALILYIMVKPLYDKRMV